MTLTRWPTDPPGKKAAHTISWSAHQANLSKPNPAAGAPAEAPVAAPGVLPLPPDALYDDQVAGLGRAREQTIAGLGQARTGGLLGYGYSEDPSTRALAFDPNNPFSRASLLKKNYDISRSRTGGQMAAGGQLYAGAFQTAQDSINRGQLGAEDSLQKSLASWLLENDSKVAQAGTDYQNGVGRAEASRTARALDNPLYSPTAATPIAGPAGQPPVKGFGRAPLGGGKPLTIKAGPGVKATKNTTVKVTKKGRTRTYTTAVKGP